MVRYVHNLIDRGEAVKIVHVGYRKSKRFNVSWGRAENDRAGPTDIYGRILFEWWHAPRDYIPAIPVHIVQEGACVSGRRVIDAAAAARSNGLQVREFGKYFWPGVPRSLQQLVPASILDKWFYERSVIFGTKSALFI